MVRKNYYIERKAKGELEKIEEAKNRIYKKLVLPTNPQKTLDEFGVKDADYWKKYNQARTSEKRMFYMLVDDLLNVIPEVPSGNGRPPIPLRDLIFCAVLKVYNNFSGRRIASDLNFAARMGFVKRVPHFNTLLAFMNNKLTQDILKYLITLSAMPLSSVEKEFAIDSSGFGTYQYERWMRFRYGDTTKRGTRNYVKCHISVGRFSHIIAAVEVTYGNLSDHNQLPYLAQQTSANFQAEKYLCDKAYSSRKNFQIINSLNALPIIPFKKNATGTSKGCPIWHAMYEYFSENKKGFKFFYRQRAQVESAFSMIKRNFGEFLKCKNFESQRNEVLLKSLCHNISCLVSEIFERNIEIDFDFEAKKIISEKPKELL